MSTTPSARPAGTPGPTRKNDAWRSGRSGRWPCVPPWLFDSSGPRGVALMRQPGLSGEAVEHLANLGARGRVVRVLEHDRRAAAGDPRHRGPVADRAAIDAEQ